MDVNADVESQERKRCFRRHSCWKRWAWGQEHGGDKKRGVAGAVGGEYAVVVERSRSDHGVCGRCGGVADQHRAFEHKRGAGRLGEHRYDRHRGSKRDKDANGLHIRSAHEDYCGRVAAATDVVVALVAFRSTMPTSGTA